MPGPAAAWNADLTKRAEAITALILDVDGVLTDGGIIYAEQGDELKRFNVQDGTGLVLWHLSGFKSAIISGRKSKTVQRRAKEMRVDHLSEGIQQKVKVYEQLLKRWRLKDAQVCVIADDLLELPMIRRAGLAVAVGNAVEDVARACHYQTARTGGQGAVREAINRILEAKGLLSEILATY